MENPAAGMVAFSLYDAIPCSPLKQTKIHWSMPSYSPHKSATFCRSIYEARTRYLTRKCPTHVIVVGGRGTRERDFSRLVFAKHVIVADVGSSWALWGTVANTQHVVYSSSLFECGPFRSFDARAAFHSRPNVQIMQAPALTGPMLAALGCPEGRRPPLDARANVTLECHIGMSHWSGNHGVFHEVACLHPTLSSKHPNISQLATYNRTHWPRWVCCPGLDHIPYELLVQRALAWLESH